MNTMRITGALAMACLGALAGAAPAGAAFPGDNGAIAFASDRQGPDFDIWTMDAGGCPALLRGAARSRVLSSPKSPGESSGVAETFV